MTDGSIHLNLEGNIFDALKELNSKFVGLQDRIEGVEKVNKSAFSKISQQLKSINLASITQQFQNLTQSLEQVNGPGLAFQTSMADLSAITGQTGKDLDILGEMARKNAKEFGGSAAQSVETFKLLLSQLTPELAKSPQLLDEMAKNSEILAKTMGGDVVAATGVLTTALNQFNVDMSNPTEAARVMKEMMNQMAASAKEGSSELPVLKDAVENVGGVARTSGLAFAPMLSALQFLDKGGKKASEGGIALRNVLTTLQQGRFLPKDAIEGLQQAGVDVQILADKTVPFTDKMRMLRGVSQDTALMTKLFGRENLLGAQILIESADAQDKQTKAIENTNTAVEQAGVIMETQAEKTARMKAAIDDAKISFFELTGGATAYLTPISELMTVMSGFSALITMTTGTINFLRNSKILAAIATKTVTAATWLWNAALNANPIGLVIAGITALSFAVYGVVKAFDTSTLAQRTNADITKELNARLSDERVELNMLFTQIRATNVGTDERTTAVQKLKDKYPGLLDQYDLEKASLREINTVQKELIANISKQMEAEIKMEKAKEIARTIEDAKDKSAFELNLWTNDQKWDYIKGLRQEQNRLIGAASSMPSSGGSTAVEPVVATSSSTTNSFPSTSISPTASSKSYEGGGTRGKSVIVNIQNLMSGDVVFSTTNMQESATAIRDMVMKALTGGVHDFELSM